MKLTLELGWRGPAGRLDPRLLPLLREIRARGTLRAAAAPAGLSYRAAWDLLAAQARALGAPLVAMARGRGARLTELAERLLAADDAARGRLDELGAGLAVTVTARAAPARLRAVASHDLLLAEFGARALDLVFRGSLESVTAYARGEAELAGFHLPAAGGFAAPYRALLEPRRDALVRFAAREQGLLVPRGNPRRLRSLADVARKRLRFVNRQRGSGTRQLIDQLLRASHLDATTLKGYAAEEYTHLAVATSVASGQADAGVGVRAAAVRVGLDFVPLARERYWLLARRRALGETRMRAWLAALRGPALQRLAKRLSGYDAKGAGEVLPLAALYEGGA